jgi:aminopeptidase
MHDVRLLRGTCADVVLRGALDLREGQVLWIRTEPFHREFAGVLARKAYDLGARYVHLSMDDPELERIRVDRTRIPEFLDYMPGFTAGMLERVVQEGWRSLALRGPENPDVMEGGRSAGLGRMQKARSEPTPDFLKAISSNRNPWNVFLMPTPPLGGQGPGRHRRLGTADMEGADAHSQAGLPDPVMAWREHDARLKRRAEFPNKEGFEGSVQGTGHRPVHRHAGRPDLLRRKRRGGGRNQFFHQHTHRGGLQHTGPRRTEGEVRCTRP